MDDVGDRASAWLADEQMNMLRHDYIARNHETVSSPGSLQGIFEQITCSRPAQMRKAVETTEGDEVKAPGVVITNEAARHNEKEYISRSQ